MDEISLRSAPAAGKKCIQRMIGNSNNPVGQSKTDTARQLTVNSLLETAWSEYLLIRIVDMYDSPADRYPRCSQQIQGAHQVVMAVEDLVPPAQDRNAHRAQEVCLFRDGNWRIDHIRAERPRAIVQHATQFERTIEGPVESYSPLLCMAEHPH